MKRRVQYAVTVWWAPAHLIEALNIVLCLIDQTSPNMKCHNADDEDEYIFKQNNYNL